MNKILLTSNGFSTERIKKEFLMVLQNPATMSRAVIITTASMEKEFSKNVIKTKKDFENMGIAQVDFFDFEIDNPRALKQYDVIYLNGGNPFQLLYWIKKREGFEIFQELADQETIFVGASAGAMVLGENIKIANFFTPEMNTVKLKNFNALGMIEELLFPHYEREDLFLDPKSRTIEQRIKEFETLSQSKITRLRDDEFIIK
ncbi:peptidase E [Planococcus sp. CPCC 101016]|uniref:Type 1 glutamine amidotransferase-like domain-containing protein n=1 Tax=Planococcus sp. CPCC 101016 TaxID=2599617 RepID=UPI0011B6DF9A|nr:Type 1 glutamine amidotransferase-like domain-containing protein [Planococcus sp. CPCC 101016]TWT07892.1 peptidase E [Planococcus sp. CPCC 101016]